MSYTLYCRKSKHFFFFNDHIYILSAEPVLIIQQYFNIESGVVRWLAAVTNNVHCQAASHGITNSWIGDHPDV